MDFGFLFYMGIMTLCLIFAPPTLTIIGTAIVLMLRRMKIIKLSNPQLAAVIGVLLFLACMATWVFVQLATKDVYAM